MNLFFGRLIFELSDDGLSGVVWRKGTLSDRVCFTADERGWEALSVYLKQHCAPVSVLINVTGEDFRQEWLPHLSGAERRQFIQRKLEQHYRHTPFRQETLIQRQTGGRYDDHLLFSALTDVPRLLFWLERLREQQIPLASVQSIPHLSRPLLSECKENHLLLMSWDKRAGLRQSYFLRQQLYFSRLIPNAENLSFGEMVAVETVRARHYLSSQNLPPDGEILRIYVVCHAAEQAEIVRNFGEAESASVAFMDIQALATRLDLRDVFPDSDATPLFIHLLATRTGRPDYLQHTDFQRNYRLWRVRQSLIVAAAALLILGVGVSLLAYQKTAALKTETAQSLAKLAPVLQRAEAARQALPLAPLASDDMQWAVSLMAQLESRSPPAGQILQNLSQVLMQFPRIQLRQLAWKSDSGNDGSAPGFAEQILLEGELSDFEGNYRKALTDLDAFQQALAQSGYSVSADAVPLDVSSQGRISRGAGASEEPSSAFSLTLRWRPPE